MAVETNREVAWILRHPAFGPDGDHPRTAVFAGSVVTLEGEAHRARRRLEAALVSASTLRRYPAIDLGGALRRALARGEATGAGDGRLRIDLVPLIRRITYSMAASVTGIDVGDGDGEITRLIDLQERMGRGAGASYDSLDRDRRIADALALRRVFHTTYVEPSLRRRSAAVRRGRRPDDLLSLLAAARLEGAALSEAVLYFLASTGTTARVIPYALGELAAAGARVPAAAPGGPDGLTLVAWESLRLHPPTPVIYRRARSPVVLPSGTAVVAGGLVRLDVRAANREPGIWGDDAGTFRPGRPVPSGLRPWGLAFGGGAHHCIGQPMAAGSKRARGAVSDGLVVRVLRPLVAAGASPDPDRPAAVETTGLSSVYRTYPVVLDAAAAAAAAAAATAREETPLHPRHRA